MIKKFLLVAFLFAVFLYSCDNEPVKYKYLKYKCRIDSIQHVHWWAYFYQVKVYYHFKYKDTVINGMYFDKRKYDLWSSDYYEGDSAIVGYNDSLKEGKLLKRIYVRKYNSHIP